MTEKQPHLVFRLIKAPASVLGCTPPEKMVLLSYVEALNPARNGTLAWPGLEVIAEQTGLNERTVRRAIDRLCELDLLKFHDRTPRSKIYAVNVGFIHRLIETGQGVQSSPPVSGQRVHSRVDRESGREWTESPLHKEPPTEPPREPPTGSPPFAVPTDSKALPDDPVQRHLALVQLAGSAAAAMRAPDSEPRTEEKEAEPEPLPRGARAVNERPG